MLFILVMDVLGHMITKATSEGLLLPLSSVVYSTAFLFMLMMWLSFSARSLEISLQPWIFLICLVKLLAQD
jgi:hypothetical protein